MSESIRLRRARAVYDHAKHRLERLEKPAASDQEIDDADLAWQLAALDLEEALQAEDSCDEAPR